MGLSSKSGKATTSIMNPDSFAVSDRDGAWRNHSKMVWQYQWQGASLVNTRILVGEDEVDIPNEQLRSLVLPPDPIPTQDPRLEPFQQDANAGNLSGYGYQNAANSTPFPVTNWDQPGQNWDTPGTMWDNVDQDVPAEVPD